MYGNFVIFKTISGSGRITSEQNCMTSIGENQARVVGKILHAGRFNSSCLRHSRLVISPSSPLIGIRTVSFEDIVGLVALVFNCI